MTSLDLYGTDEPPPRRITMAIGAAEVTLENGALRYLRIGTTELIRGIACLIRDADWGTLAPLITDETLTQTADGFQLTYTAHYTNGPATLTTRIAITAAPGQLDFTAHMQAKGGFQTNRAGFVVLHSADLTGQPLAVGHGATTEHSHFPDLIAPWQPFSDITGLTHTAGVQRVTCTFEGDTFEMEDQRQWSDASFKTYVRPLALPWPYTIPDSQTVTQAVHLRWSPAPLAAAPAKPPATAKTAFPQTALVITAADARRALTTAELDAIAPQRLLCHFDATCHDPAWLLAFAALQTAHPCIAFDLEYIALCADPAQEFTALAAHLKIAAFAPASIMVCPAVDRQSTPPGSAWPACLPLTEIHAAARAAFPDQTLGGGMASFFPELNRKRPPVEMLDFVTHGTCPIVHAADDASVMETLQAIPHITRSARAIIGAKDYRLGPSTIAMRQNPYGSRTIPNPDRRRVCMADDDPRQTAAFAAAYTLGFATAIANAGVTVWTPAALYGPRGLFADDGKPHPLAAVIAQLARHAGYAVDDAILTGTDASLTLDGARFQAHLTAPYACTVPGA